MIYWIAYLFMKLLDKVYFSCRFKGREYLPAQGSFIIASNHISNLDPFILGICRWSKFSYLAKDSLFKNKLAAFFFYQVGAFPVKRDTADFRAIRESLKRLKRGCPLILFPEGTRGVGGRTKEPQPGAGLIAAKSRVPIIPAFIEGSDKAFPNGSKWFHRHQVKITFGNPLSFSSDLSSLEISQQIVDAIYSIPTLSK